MKTYTYYFLLTFALLAGCSKNDGPIPKDVILERVPEPQVVKESGSQSIDVTNLDGFQAEFNVGVYYTSGVKPSKYDVVIMKNDSSGNVKLFHKDVSIFPTTLTITINDIQTLFGAPVVLGDNYDIGVDVYTASGKKYQAFPAAGVGYGSNIASQPGASVSIRYSAICQYHDDVYQGNFKVLINEWNDDYAPGDIVPVTRIDATHFSFKYAAPDALPIIVTVNPLTNEISVAKQVYGPIGYPPDWPYGPISCESVPDQGNVVSPCDETFSVKLQHTVSAGSFGNAVIKMQKVN